ncbi:Hypp2930 [Branchiostoma lanceolatum]|uniref:Hypp2930 protein n=1 Tax=Branchiostoma lanceolatum TaxID=7740 RepID=A0A8K0A060_BRALA|nr:Hypp2930 [Branchiostoma lanceolatum]
MFCGLGNVTSETDKTGGIKTVYIVAVTVAIIIPASLLVTVLCWRKQRVTRNNFNAVSAAVHVDVQVMAVCISVDKEEGAKTDTNFPNSLQSDETQPAAGATHTAQAGVHYYSNGDTPVHSEDDDDEVLDHQYASAAPPPVPLYDDNGDDPRQEAARHSAETGQTEQSASKIVDTDESGDGHEPYGIAATNPVYE